MRKLSVVAISLLSAFTWSCSNSSEPTGKSETKAKTSTALSMSTLRTGPQFIKLHSCQEIIDELQRTSTKRVTFSAPVHQFVINIKKGDPHSLDRDMTKNGSTNGLTEDFSNGKPTKWDFDADLRDPTETANDKVYQTALLTLEIKQNSKVKFVDDPEYVLRAGSVGSVAMFCDPKMVDADTATLTIFRAPEAQIDKGSFNLGLIVEDNGGQHEMPVFYDPEVKNDG